MELPPPHLFTVQSTLPADAPTDALTAYSADAARECVSPSGDPVTCCIWEPSPWTASYLRIAAATLAWILITGFQVKVWTASFGLNNPYGSNATVLHRYRHLLFPPLFSRCSPYLGQWGNGTLHLRDPLCQGPL